MRLSSSYRTKVKCPPRFCTVHHALNKRIKVDRYTIRNIEEKLDGLKGFMMFSKGDMFAWYWQVRLAEQVQKQTVFRCNYGTSHFQVSPLRLMNVPALLQRMESSLFRDIPYVRKHIHNVVLGTRSMREHTRHLVVVC